MGVRIVSGVVTGLVFHLWFSVCVCTCVCPVGYTDDTLLLWIFCILIDLVAFSALSSHPLRKQHSSHALAFSVAELYYVLCNILISLGRLLNSDSYPSTHSTGSRWLALGHQVPLTRQSYTSPAAVRAGAGFLSSQRITRATGKHGTVFPVLWPHNQWLADTAADFMSQSL